MTAIPYFSEFIIQEDYYDALPFLKNEDTQPVFQLLEKVSQQIGGLSGGAFVNQPHTLNAKEIALLLSPGAQKLMEPMAQLSQKLSLNHFGKAVILYTPIYVSNYCINGCLYCSYGAAHDIKRRMLTPEEIDAEALAVAQMGLKHVLLLTGESEQAFNFSQIVDAVKQLTQTFDSVSIETYGLTLDEYKTLNVSGNYGVTLYQETYHLERYKKLHPFGPKSDYEFRLNAPMRVGQSGARAMNIGVLMGLADWREDVLALSLHGQYLAKYFPEMEVAFSLPRLKDYEGSNFEVLELQSIEDIDYVQGILALRLSLPHASHNVSTRESAHMRANLLPLGVNKMSAGVSTEVGGHTLADKGDGQFNIADDSSVAQVMQMIREAGYQPILRDWISGI